MDDQWKHRPAAVRNDIAQLLDCNSSDIAFLPNVSSAVNLVAGGLDWKPGDNVVITCDQFPANVYPWMFLQSVGVEIRFADWHAFGFTDSIRRVVDKRTKVVAVSWVEYFSGHRHSLEDVGFLCKKQGIIYLVDAIQGLGALPFKNDAGADVIAVGGQKWLLGPDGQGVAYFNPGVLDMLKPSVFSWRSIEDFMNLDSYRLELKPGAQRFEAGTPNWAGIFGLGAGVKIILDIGLGNIARQIENLTTKLMAELQELPVEVITPAAWMQRAGIVSFRPLAMRAEDLQIELLSRGIVCSARRGALRVSPHFYNTEAEIDKFVMAIKIMLCQP